MKAVVKFKDGKDGWEIRDVERADPGPGEVEIEVKYVGICGSELHLYHDQHFYIPPVIVGHEFSGVISRVGANVRGWKVGDKVVSENQVGACRACEYCRSGLMHFCSERKPVGYVSNGYWTQYVCRPSWMLHKVPSAVSLEEAALTEPTTVAVSALCERHQIKTGDVVLVQGCGPIGLLAAMVSKAAGAGHIVVTGTSADKEARLPVAESLGVDRVINISEEDIKPYIMEVTNGKGVDVVVEASGAPAAISSAIDVIKKRGTLIAIGEVGDDIVSYRWTTSIFKAVSILFTYGSTYDSWETALKLMSNHKINVKPLITHVLPLERWREGFELLEQKKGIKVLMTP